MSESKTPDKPGTSGEAAKQTPDQKPSASMKPFRDVLQGGVKPKPKKIFTPNLNVTRRKDRCPLPNLSENKRQEESRWRQRRNNNKNGRTEPNIIKSSGVFSEGLAAVEMQPGRSRDAVPPPTLHRPTIRVKDVSKIGKEFDEREKQNVTSGLSSDEINEEDFRRALEMDAPVKLPMGDGGRPRKRRIQKPASINQEVVDGETGVADEPVLVNEGLDNEPSLAQVLQSDKTTLVLLQFPTVMPLIGWDDDDEPQPGSSDDPATDDPATAGEPKGGKSLFDGMEGRIGTIKVHQSGRVVMHLNGGHQFELSLGTNASFQQEAVSLAVNEEDKTAEMISLGNIEHKIIVTPDWEHLLAKAKADKDKCYKNSFK